MSKFFAPQSTTESDSTSTDVPHDIFDEDEDDEGDIDDSDYDDDSYVDNDDDHDGESDDEESEEDGDEQSDDEPDDEDQPKKESKVIVEVDGEKITLEQLKTGYMKNEDYTRKTQEVSEAKKLLSEYHQGLNQENARIGAIIEKTKNFLVGLVPQEPDIRLARSDPASYQEQLHIRNKIIEQVNSIINSSEVVSQAENSLNENQISYLMKQKEKDLVYNLPYLRDKAKMDRFNEDVIKTAEEFGFTRKDVESTSDARILMLAHYAKIGKLAESNRKALKSRKTISKSPTPEKRSPIRVSGKGSEKNQKYLKRLERSGSIEDATKLNIEW